MKYIFQTYLIGMVKHISPHDGTGLCDILLTKHIKLTNQLLKLNPVSWLHDNTSA